MTLGIRLKYQRYLAEIPNCPPASSSRPEGYFFRFVFDDPMHPNNFCPVAMINPKRRFVGDEQHCSGYALSMFVTAVRAVDFYHRFVEKRPNAYKVLGTHLAEVSIGPDDGLITQPDAKGHVDVHEADTVDWSSKYSIIQALHQG